MRRAVRAAVAPQGMDPPADQFPAVDATAAGQPIYDQENGQGRETNYSCGTVLS